MSATMRMKIEFEGLKELKRHLETLGERVYNRTMKAAMTAGAKLIWMASRRNLKTGRGDWPPTGALKKAMGAVIRMNKGRQSALAVIGPRRGYGVVTIHGRKHDPANLGHLVEKGHGGPKPAPPHPFMRPAFDGQKGAAFNAIADRIRKGIAKEAARK